MAFFKGREGQDRSRARKLSSGFLDADTPISTRRSGFSRDGLPEAALDPTPHGRG